MDSRKEVHMNMGNFLLLHMIYLTFLFGTPMTLIGLKRLNVQNEKNSETEKNNLAILSYGEILVTIGCVTIFFCALNGIKL